MRSPSGAAAKLVRMPRRAPDIEDLVRAWLDDKQAARPEGIGQRLADYEGALAIGTEHDDWSAGREAFRTAHLSGGPFTASVDAVEAHQEGPVAWAAVRAVIETGDPGGLPVRLTLVLVDSEDGWRIVQSHASGA